MRDDPRHRPDTRYRFAPLQLREDGDGRVLEGVVVTYGETAPAFAERIEAGAFGDVDLVDVVLNVQHDRGRALCRSGAGLTLTDSAAALTVRAELPPTRDGDDCLVLIRAGVLRGISAEFFIREAHPSAEGIETVTAAELVGLAVVDRPAFPGSTVEARAAKGPEIAPGAGSWF